MSPSTAVTVPAGSRAASRASISGLVSAPTTSTSRAAIGMARRPVPTPSSSTRGRRSPDVERASSTMTSALTSASLIPAYHSSYTSANAAPYDCEV